MAMGGLSYYDALGITRNATTKDIKTAYKKQSLALHPDKNKYGQAMMKFVNEAHATLSDEVTREIYDMDILSTCGNNDIHRGRNDSSKVNALKQKLVESEKKQRNLRAKIATLEGDMHNMREESLLSEKLLSEKNAQNKKLQHKQQRIENEVTFLKSEKESLEQENKDHKRQNEVYESKMERTARALREERRQSAGELADQLARSEERAKGQVEELKKSMSDRSVCYQCDGKALNEEDCTLCHGHGAIQGLWTKCCNCHGTGSFTSISGDAEDCNLCSSRGAREGILTMTCFKCKGIAYKDCNLCYKGKIRGFNIKLCPICRGAANNGKCDNCTGKAYVSCQCGPGCKGHGPHEGKMPKGPSSLQRRLALEAEKGKSDWSAIFMTRTGWKSPLLLLESN